MVVWGYGEAQQTAPAHPRADKSSEYENQVRHYGTGSKHGQPLQVPGNISSQGSSRTYT
jgi:hypothetical protein